MIKIGKMHFADSFELIAFSLDTLEYNLKSSKGLEVFKCTRETF